MDRPGLYIPLSRRHFLLGLAVGVWTLAACRPQAPPSPTSSLVRQRAAPGELTGVLPNSDLAVGPNNRFLLALLDDRNRPVTDGQVWLRFFKLIDQNTAELRVETMAVYRGSAELGDRGVYVARVGFDQPGTWGVEVQVLRPDGASHLLRLGFEVRAQGLSGEEERKYVQEAVRRFEEEMAAAPAPAPPPQPPAAQGKAPLTPAERAARIALAQKKAEVIKKAREEARAKGLTGEEERKYVQEALHRLEQEGEGG